MHTSWLLIFSLLSLWGLPSCQAATTPTTAVADQTKFSATCAHYLPSVDLCVEMAHGGVQSRGFYMDLVFWRMDPQNQQRVYFDPPQTLEKNGEVWQLGVDPFMNSMGHGTRFDTDIRMVLVESSQLFPNVTRVYRVGPIDFVMGGPWQIRVLYGHPQAGPMPRSLEWTTVEKVELDLEVPW